MEFELTAVDVGLGLCFAAWFAASCLRQFPGEKVDRWCAWDVVGILPVWRFFAPVPGPFDFHLLYRDRGADGVVTDWTEFQPVPRRRWSTMVWNPDKRLRKAMLDLSQELARAQSKQPPEQIMLSVPYLVLLQFISALPRAAPVAQTQFAIMVSEGAEYDAAPAVLFLSSFHAVG